MKSNLLICGTYEIRIVDSIGNDITKLFVDSNNGNITSVCLD